MKHTPTLGLMTIVLAMAWPARADIVYYDLNQGRKIGTLTPAGKTLMGNNIPIGDPAYWTSAYQHVESNAPGESWSSLGGSYASGTWGYRLHVNNTDSSAWTDGLRTNPAGGANLLGNSHNGLYFANFHLAGPSLVTIQIFDEWYGQNSGFGLNPSFSLYAGSVVYRSHDNQPVDPLNPRSGLAKVQNPKDTGSAVDSQGITSPYRNTVTNTGSYSGQFNAVGGWSMGNVDEEWSALQYLTSVTGAVDPSGYWSGNPNFNELAGYWLPAGDYTIVFGGNAQPLSYSTARSGDSFDLGAIPSLQATLTFQAVAAPVPEPQTWGIMLAGLALVGGIARRRLASAAPGRQAPLA
jgi:hypothetical protein